MCTRHLLLHLLLLSHLILTVYKVGVKTPSSHSEPQSLSWIQFTWSLCLSSSHFPYCSAEARRELHLDRTVPAAPAVQFLWGLALQLAGEAALSLSHPGRAFCSVVSLPGSTVASSIPLAHPPAREFDLPSAQ